MDSPYYIDIQPYTPSYKGFQHEEEQKYKYMNTRNIISEECAARYPSSPPADVPVTSSDTPVTSNTHVTSNTPASDTPVSDTPFVNEQWKCQFGQYRLPFVQTSYFMVTSQYDSYQLQMDLGQAAPPPFKSPGETVYAEQFATTLQQQVGVVSTFTYLVSLLK